MTSLPVNVTPSEGISECDSLRGYHMRIQQTFLVRHYDITATKGEVTATLPMDVTPPKGVS